MHTAEPGALPLVRMMGRPAKAGLFGFAVGATALAVALVSLLLPSSALAVGLVSPPDESIVSRQPTLRWALSPGEAAADVVLFRYDLDYNEGPHVAIPVSGATSYTPPAPLEPGEYGWFVRTETGATSEKRSFFVPRPATYLSVRTRAFPGATRFEPRTDGDGNLAFGLEVRFRGRLVYRTSQLQLESDSYLFLWSCNRVGTHTYRLFVVDSYGTRRAASGQFSTRSCRGRFSGSMLGGWHDRIVGNQIILTFRDRWSGSPRYRLCLSAAGERRCVTRYGEDAVNFSDFRREWAGRRIYARWYVAGRLVVSRSFYMGIGD